jgi:hypothetical protein
MSFAVNAQLPSTFRSFVQILCQFVWIAPASVNVSPAVAQHLDALGAGRGVAGAVHYEVGAEGFGQPAYGLYARLGRFVVLERDGGLGAEAPAQREPRILGCPDDDDPPRPHLLGGGHGQNADRPRALDDDGVAYAKEADALGAVESADARGERLGEGAQSERHVVGQLVDLRPRQLVEIDVDHLRPATPEVWRLLKA